MSNNKIPTLEYKSKFQKKPMKVNLIIGAYLDNHSLCVRLISAKECEFYCDMTVNVNGSDTLPPYQAAVKNYSENEGMEKFIEGHGLGMPTGQTIRSGFVELPVYQFDQEKLLAFSLNGAEDYEGAQGTPTESTDPFEDLDAVRITL